IDALGLLVERTIQVSKGGKLTNVVKGLKVVDEKKLNQLPEADFVSLRNKGALPLVYAHLLSWANFRQCPLAVKYPDLAAKPAVKEPTFLFVSDIIGFSGLPRGHLAGRLLLAAARRTGKAGRGRPLRRDQPAPAAVRQPQARRARLGPHP